MSSFLLEESCYINTLFRDLFQRLRTVTNLTTSSDLAHFDLPLRSLPPSFAPSARLFFFRSPSSTHYFLPPLTALSPVDFSPPSRSFFLSLQSLYQSLSNSSSFLHFASLPSFSAPFRLFTLLPSLSISLPCTSLQPYLSSFLLSSRPTY